MSKPKAQKVEIEEEKSSKLGFENAPKLFSKWAYDEVKVLQLSRRLKIPASSIISQSRPPSPRSSCPTPPQIPGQEIQEKLSAPSSRDSSAPCSSPAETPERKSKPAEL